MATGLLLELGSSIKRLLLLVLTLITVTSMEALSKPHRATTVGRWLLGLHDIPACQSDHYRPAGEPLTPSSITDEQLALDWGTVAIVLGDPYAPNGWGEPLELDNEPTE